MTEPGPGARAHEILRDVVAAVDDGALEATPEQRAYVAGAVAALEPVVVQESTAPEV